MRGAPHPGEVRGGADEERIFSYVAALARLPRPALPVFESFLVKCLKFNLQVTYTTSPMYSLTGVAYGVARTHSGFVDPSSFNFNGKVLSQPPYGKAWERQLLAR